DGWAEEEGADQVDHGDLRSVGRRRERQTLTGRTVRHVRRPAQALALLQVRNDLTAAPGVVPERDHVRAGGEHLVCELGRDADAVGEVLAVEDAEIHAQFFAERGQAFLDGPSPGHTDRICNEQDSQGKSVAAARSSMATWLPASCVYFESACFSTPDRSRTRPTLVLDAAIVEPTVRAGSGLRCVSETTSDGAAEGWMSMREPYGRPSRM